MFPKLNGLLDIFRPINSKLSNIIFDLRKLFGYFHTCFFKISCLKKIVNKFIFLGFIFDLLGIIILIQ